MACKKLQLITLVLIGSNDQTFGKAIGFAVVCRFQILNLIDGYEGKTAPVAAEQPV